MLLEAKGPGYAWALDDNGQFFDGYRGEEKLVQQMANQSEAAGDRIVEWHAAEPAFAAYLRNLATKYPNIVVIWEPKR